MAQNDPDRASNGFTTSVKPLGNGKWGARVYNKNGKVIQEDNKSTTKQEAAKALKELLRWVDKLGYDCPMADASRDRTYCKPKEK